MTDLPLPELLQTGHDMESPASTKREPTMTLKLRIAVAAALLTLLSFVVGIGVGLAMAATGGGASPDDGRPAASEPGCEENGPPAQREV